MMFAIVIFYHDRNDHLNNYDACLKIATFYKLQKVSVITGPLMF